MSVCLVFLEWGSIIAAAWCAAEAQAAASPFLAMVAVMAAVIAGLTRSLALQGMLTREMDALYGRLRLGMPRGGTR